MPDSIVSLNEESLRADLRELVRRTVEEMLNGLLDEEADDLVGAERYERTADREAYRAGHYERKLATTSGEVTIRMPKLKGMRFTTAIIERCRRRETSVEEAMIGMCLAGVSTRRIEDVSGILWGSSVPAATVSNLNERAFEAVEARRSRPLERAYPYVYVDGIWIGYTRLDSFTRACGRRLGWPIQSTRGISPTSSRGRLCRSTTQGSRQARSCASTISGARRCEGGSTPSTPPARRTPPTTGRPSRTGSSSWSARTRGSAWRSTS